MSTNGDFSAENLTHSAMESDDIGWNQCFSESEAFTPILN